MEDNIEYCSYPVKVMRLRLGCCGMKDGEIYEGKSNFSRTYVNVKLPDGTWTGDHWTGGDCPAPYFNFIE